jgi:penicillin-binding protein 1A
MLKKRSNREKDRRDKQIRDENTAQTPKTPPPTPNKISKGKRKRLFGARFYTVLGCATVMVFIALGLGLAYVKTTLSGLDPILDKMEDYRPKQITRMLDSEDNLVGEIFEERRELVDIRDVPRHLIEALVATEDKKFFNHSGVDPVGILRAVLANVKSGHRGQGASTITQQLARNLFTSREKTYGRKIREALLALRITQRYTKLETLEIYLNQVPFGHNAHGIQSAARFYFDKDVSDLDLVESAMMVGLLKAPTRYSPYLHPQRAAQRRRVVMQCMVRSNYLGEREMKRARDQSLRLAKRRTYTVSQDIQAPYFWEYVRKQLGSREYFGSAKKPGMLSAEHGNITYDDIRAKGFNIETNLSITLQDSAKKALRTQVKLLEQERRLHPWHWGDKEPPPQPEKISDGVELDAIIVRPEKRRVWVSLPILKDASKLVAIPFDYDKSWLPIYGVYKEGYYVRVIAHKLSTKDPNSGLSYRFSLLDEPHMEGAVVVLEVASGKILALVGGMDYYESNFIRAAQAMRQPGSAFKPVVYAAALEQREEWLKEAHNAARRARPAPQPYGMTLASRLYDMPLTFTFNGKEWSPGNYHGDVNGPVTVRYAMEKSLNLASIDLMMRMNKSSRWGIRETQNMAKRLGISTPVSNELVVSLGTSDVSPLEMAAAYASFANGGIYNQPYAIKRMLRQEDGRVVYKHKMKSHLALSPRTAFLTTRMLESVVRRGTGTKANMPWWTVAGKTGTTSDFSDAWFAGYSSGVCCVVFLGLDRKKSMGIGMEGAHAALPIWMEVMQAAREIYPSHFREWDKPDDIVEMRVCRYSGLLPRPDCPQYSRTMTAFIKGTEPTHHCDLHDPDYGRNWVDWFIPPDTRLNELDVDIADHKNVALIEEQPQQSKPPEPILDDTYDENEYFDF